MFQFTTETIIKSNVDSSGATKFFANGNTFSVLRAGNFKKAEVVSVFKNPYSAAVKETLVETLTGTYTATKVYRLAIDAKLSGSANSEWANEFVIRSKRFFYEITGVSTAAGAAEAFAKAVLREQTVSGFSLFTLVQTGSSAELTLTAGTEYQRFLKVEVQELLDNTVVNGAVLTGYDNYTVLEDLKAAPTSYTVGKQGFGTTTWLTKNLRLPTIDRTNYTAIAQDELPSAGGQYTQYSIRIMVRRGEMGMGTVGQDVTSITTHIFYVLSTQVSAFESAMTTAGLTILNAIPASGSEFVITADDSTIVVGDFATLTPVGAVGAVTYVSGTTATIATVDANGVTSAGLQAGTTVVTGTDSLGNTGTITLTVIA